MAWWRWGVAVLDDALVVSIKDRGVGIPEELGNRIFEPFFSTKTGKGTEGGLGLGLSTALQLAERLGATLDYESEVARGTTFRLHLPGNRLQRVAA